MHTWMFATGFPIYTNKNKSIVNENLWYIYKIIFINLININLQISWSTGEPVYTMYSYKSFLFKPHNHQKY